MRTTLVVLLLAAPLGGLLGGTAHAAPYLPPGAAVPASGTISRDADAAVVKAVVVKPVVAKPAGVKATSLRAPVVRSRPAPVRHRSR